MTPRDSETETEHKGELSISDCPPREVVSPVVETSQTKPADVARNVSSRPDVHDLAAGLADIRDLPPKAVGPLAALYIEIHAAKRRDFAKLVARARTVLSELAEAFTEGPHAAGRLDEVWPQDFADGSSYPTDLIPGEAERREFVAALRYATDSLQSINPGGLRDQMPTVGLLFAPPLRGSAKAADVAWVATIALLKHVRGKRPKGDVYEVARRALKSAGLTRAGKSGSTRDLYKRAQRAVKLAFAERTKKAFEGKALFDRYVRKARTLGL